MARVTPQVPAMVGTSQMGFRPVPSVCEWTFAGSPRCTRSAVGKVNGIVPICRECAERANLTHVVLTVPR